MPDFYSLNVARLERQPAETVVIELDIPNNLVETFTYKAGQYLTFDVTVNGEALRRSYSLCSSPHQGGNPRIAVKQVKDGRVSTELNQNLKEGDTLQVMPPQGRFVVEPKAGHAGQYVLFAGGSGITPILGIIESVLAIEPNSKIILVYANRNPQSVIFDDRLTELQKEHGTRLTIEHIYDQPAKKPSLFSNVISGPLDKKKVRKLLKRLSPTGLAEYFVCGPQGMMTAVLDGLKASGVSDDKVNVEYFSAVEEKKTEASGDAPAADGPSEVTVILDGDTHTLSVGPDESILNAALDAGIDAPYSCQGAVCATCMARVKEGKTFMEMNYVLSDAEVDDGLIVSCQAHPRSPKVVVSFDDV